MQRTATSSHLWSSAHWSGNEVRRERVIRQFESSGKRRERLSEKSDDERREVDGQYAAKRRAFRRELHLKNIELFQRRNEVSPASTQAEDTEKHAQGRVS